MITSDKRDNIDRQLVDIAINTRPKAGESVFNTVGGLPFDPTAPPDDTSDTVVIAPNLLDNSDFDFSKDGYVNNPTVGGDAAQECYNWYRQRFIKVTDIVISGAPTPTANAASGPFKSSYSYPMDFVLLNGNTGGAALVGTLTRVSDTQATLSVSAQNDIPSGGVLWFGTTLAENSTNAVKASGHSTFAANEGANDIIPRWDKTNGWLEIGSDNDDRFDLACPLALNYVRPGLIYYFRCIVKLRSGASTGSDIRLSAGIWDATSAQKRFLESSNMDLSVTPVGTTGATTYKYVVLGDLDDGTTVISDVVTITNGNASLSTSNYNRLVWENATGIIRFRIYREVGGVVKRIFTITNGGHDYNDYGTDEGETPVALPTAGTTRPIAYKVSSAFNPSADGWASVNVQLEIPASYDTANTTGKQWLRVAVEGTCGSERMVLIDRIMLSTSNGGWQRSARDLAKIANQNPSSLPSGSDQGTTGIGPRCFPADTPIFICDYDGSNIREINIGDAKRGMLVLSGSMRPNMIKKVRPGRTTEMVSCVLSNGISFRCTPSERFITSRADVKGTRIDRLTLGDEILCWNNGRVEKATIEQMTLSETDEEVFTLSLTPQKTFVVGVSNGCGAIAHNRKFEGDF